MMNQVRFGSYRCLAGLCMEMLKPLARLETVPNLDGIKGLKDSPGSTRDTYEYIATQQVLQPQGWHSCFLMASSSQLRPPTQTLCHYHERADF
jgi:hypothetical protein